MARASAKRGRRPSANARRSPKPLAPEQAVAVEQPKPAVAKPPEKAERKPPAKAAKPAERRSLLRRKPKQKTARSVEDTMFFTRLRRKTKWVFWLLAAAFALGFLVFGVGTGTNSGIGDVLHDIFGGSGSGTVTLSDAQKKVAEHPNDAPAVLQLATLQQRNHLYTAAAASLERYTKLEPKDAAGYQQLGSVRDLQARQASMQSQQLAAQSSLGSFSGSVYSFPKDSGFTGAVGFDPIQQAIAGQFSSEAGQASRKGMGFARQSMEAYQKVTQLTPKDAQSYLLLGQAALNANEQQTALTALQKFLVLAPDDPAAKSVRTEVKQLQKAQTAGAQNVEQTG